LVDRWLADARTRERSLQSEAAQLDRELGAARTIRSPSVAEAEQLLASRQNARADVLDRVDRCKSDTRRNREDSAQIAARIKQVKDEIEKMDGYVQSASVASTQGFEEAMQQLMWRRRAAVVHHIEEVLAELEKSTNSIDAVFVEPARTAMLKAEQPAYSVAAAVREAATKVEAKIHELVADIEPELLSQDAMMSQVQREFCDAAPTACRNAWN
jgi:phage terminase small subunit